MQKWVVHFDDLKTVDVLEEMGILHYKPLFYEKLKFVFIETNMSEDEISNITGITSCRKEAIGRFGI